MHAVMTLHQKEILIRNLNPDMIHFFKRQEPVTDSVIKISTPDLLLNHYENAVQLEELKGALRFTSPEILDTD